MVSVLRTSRLQRCAIPSLAFWACRETKTPGHALDTKPSLSRAVLLHSSCASLKELIIVIGWPIDRIKDGSPYGFNRLLDVDDKIRHIAGYGDADQAIDLGYHLDRQTQIDDRHTFLQCGRSALENC